jgi:non-ribosomal peptide synthetase component F
MVLDDIRSCVARAPDAIAVQDGELRLTYLELARYASGLAARLTRRGIGPDDVVAVYAGRSAELVVAELSVLLAGAAYLPLDPAHPAARISELLALSGAAAVISTGPLLADDGLRGHDLEVVDLMEVPPEPLAVPAKLDDATLAYVIYTSGSTGRPRA